MTGHFQNKICKDEIIDPKFDGFNVKYVFVEPNLLVPLENFWANGLIANKIGDVPGLGKNIVHLQQGENTESSNASASQVTVLQCPPDILENLEYSQNTFAAFLDCKSFLRLSRFAWVLSLSSKNFNAKTSIGLIECLGICRCFLLSTEA